MMLKMGIPCHAHILSRKIIPQSRLQQRLMQSVEKTEPNCTDLLIVYNNNNVEEENGMNE